MQYRFYSPSGRTFVFDPLGSPVCNSKALVAKKNVPLSVLESLHELGEAEFPVHTGSFNSNGSRSHGNMNNPRVWSAILLLRSGLSLSPGSRSIAKKGRVSAPLATRVAICVGEEAH